MPFIPDIEKRNKSVVASRVGEVYSQVTGELISDNVSLVVHKAIDKSEFVKLFCSGIDFMFNLRESEFKVFFYLLKNLQMNTGKAWFDMDECMEVTGFGKIWIYKALGCLCEKKFIARTNNKCFYWINHSIAFNGSRLFIKQKNEE